MVGHDDHTPEYATRFLLYFDLAVSLFFLFILPLSFRFHAVSLSLLSYRWLFLRPALLNWIPLLSFVEFYIIRIERSGYADVTLVTSRIAYRAKACAQTKIWVSERGVS